MISLYLKTTQPSTKKEIKQKLESPKEEDKINALKNLITLITQGTDCSDQVHLTIKAVAPHEKNKEIKKLFYLFLELIPKTDKDGRLLSEVLLMCNQIRKDIVHPNEYVRGMAMRLIGRMDNYEVLEMVYKPVKDNLRHPHSYVRRCACLCISQMYKAHKSFSEVPGLLLEVLNNDADPLCLRQAYASLLSINKKHVLQFNKRDVEGLPEEVLEIMQQNISEESFFMRCMNLPNKKIAFNSCIEIIRNSREEEAVKAAVDCTLSILSDEKFSGYKMMAVEEFGRNTVFGFKGYAGDILALISSFSVKEASLCISFVFKIVETHEFMLLGDFLVSKFKESNTLNIQKQEFRIFLVEKMVEYVKYLGTATPEMVEITMKEVVSENPGLAYASLQFLRSYLCIFKNDKIVKKIVYALKEIKFGKIFRFALTVLNENLKEEEFNSLLVLFEEVLSKKEGSFKEGREPLLDSLYREDTPFLGTYVSLTLTSLVLRFMQNNNPEFMPRVIAILLRFIDQGNLTNKMDKSSHSLIISCIRNMIHPLPPKKIEHIPVKSVAVNNNVLETPVFSLIPLKETDNQEMLQDFLYSHTQPLSSIKNIIQLTGLADPIYSEAGVKYSRSEITIDLLLINQTDSFLQNIVLDFTTTKNVSENFVITPFNMSPRTIKNISYTFSVLESSSGFICGSIFFNFPGERGEYANSSYLINLSEIKFNISDFLQSKEISDCEFRSTWPLLEWENSYAVKFSTPLSLKGVLGVLTDTIKGTVVAVEAGEEYLVSNVVCTTYQGSDIFLNLCFQIYENVVGFNCRIRSSKEDVVKSLSGVVGEKIKEMRGVKC